MIRQRAIPDYFASLKWSAMNGSIAFKRAAKANFEELSLPLDMILDTEVRTGWRKLQPGVVDYLYHPDKVSGSYPPEPEENFQFTENKPWKRVMSFLVTGSALQNEITEMSLSSVCAMNAFDDLLMDCWWTESDEQKGAAKIKLTDATKVETSHGVFYAPVLDFCEAVDRDQWFADKDVCSAGRLWVDEDRQVQPRWCLPKRTKAERYFFH